MLNVKSAATAGTRATRYKQQVGSGPARHCDHRNQRAQPPTLQYVKAESPLVVSPLRRIMHIYSQKSEIIVSSLVFCFKLSLSEWPGFFSDCRGGMMEMCGGWSSERQKYTKNPHILMRPWPHIACGFCTPLLYHNSLANSLHFRTANYSVTKHDREPQNSSNFSLAP